ncbi:MAG TPA: DUF4232 domain-containing protein [Streptosporangiaceae bacterium]|nr:DUF4232 domain-containing protein [Streptosporangiaceae bacterium]
MRTSRTLVLLAAVTALATGCHSSTSGSAAGSPSGSPSGSQSEGTSGSAAPTGPASEGLATCRTSSLRITLDTSLASGAAGSTYYPIDLTNTSGVPCELAGYPGVSFVTAADGTGRQIGAAAQRNPQFGSVVVRLDSGGHAHAWLQVAQAGNYPASSCSPATAHGLRVYPPDETQAGYIQQDLPACAIASAQVLTVLPVRGGEGARGIVP